MTNGRSAASIIHLDDAYGFPCAAKVLNQATQPGPVVPTHDGLGDLSSAGPVVYAQTVEKRPRDASGVRKLADDP